MVLTASLDLLCQEKNLSVDGAAPDMEYSCALAAALLPPSVTEVWDCVEAWFDAALGVEALRVAAAGAADINGADELTADRFVISVSSSKKVVKGHPGSGHPLAALRSMLQELYAGDFR